MLHVEILPLGAYQTNCYIAWGEGSDECIVIDPGYAPEQVILEAEDLGKKIDAVLLTHGHFDHVGGVKGIAERLGCPVYLHEQELSQPEAMTAGPLYYTCTYGEGDVLKLAGLTIRVLHTPGHTPGSVCLLCDDTLFPRCPRIHRSVRDPLVSAASHHRHRAGADHQRGLHFPVRGHFVRRADLLRLSPRRKNISPISIWKT